MSTEDKIPLFKQSSYTKSEAFMLSNELSKYADKPDCYNKICSLKTGSKELTELCNNMIDDIIELTNQKPNYEI